MAAVPAAPTACQHHMLLSPGRAADAVGELAQFAPAEADPALANRPLAACHVSSAAATDDHRRLGPGAASAGPGHRSPC